MNAACTNLSKNVFVRTTQVTCLLSIYNLVIFPTAKWYVPRAEVMNFFVRYWWKQNLRFWDFFNTRVLPGEDITQPFIDYKKFIPLKQYFHQDNVHIYTHISKEKKIIKVTNM